MLPKTISEDFEVLHLHGLYEFLAQIRDVALKLG